MSVRSVNRWHVVAAAAVMTLVGTVAVAGLARAATVPLYAVIGATQKVMATQATVTGSAGADLMAARNEFASFQIVLPGGAAGQAGVSVATATPLTGPAGTIPNNQITIYREEYYTTTRASAGGRELGPWPDALIPSVDTLYGERRNAFPVDVPANGSRVVFVDILVPISQSPGRYEGSLLITNGGSGQVTVPVRVEVRDFTLPSTSSLTSTFGIGWLDACDALYPPGCDPWSSAANEDRAWRANADVARLGLNNRITITNPRFQPPSNDAERAFFATHMLPLVNGTAATQLPGARQTAVDVDLFDKQGNLTLLSDWKRVAEQYGFTDRAVSYWRPECDEPQAHQRWQPCKDNAPRFKTTWPGLPNIITAAIQDVDVQDPSFAITDRIVVNSSEMDGVAGDRFPGSQRDKYNTFLSNPGKQLWLYTACDAFGCGTDGAGETHPRYQYKWLDYSIDTAASQNRAMGWLAAVYDTSGELYFHTTLKMRSAWTDQWENGGNGNGNLFYPGTPDRIGGRTPIPVESLRLKMIRNGYQDYEYLRLARAHGRGAEALALARNTYPTLHDAAPSDAAIENARRQVADLIAPPALQYTATRLTGAVTVDGQLGEYAGLPSVSFPTGNNTVGVQLAWDSQRLYAAYTVTDATINVNQTGRDGEVWNGDGVELLLDRGFNRSAVPDSDDYQSIVNTDNALTDGQGNGTGGWNRAFNGGVLTAVRLAGTGFTVEIAVPWASIGGSPSQGAALGLDMANNDSDSAGTVAQHDWAQLSRFAQPDHWGKLILGGPA